MTVVLAKYRRPKDIKFQFQVVKRGCATHTVAHSTTSMPEDACQTAGWNGGRPLPNTPDLCEREINFVYGKLWEFPCFVN